MRSRYSCVIALAFSAVCSPAQSLPLATVRGELACDNCTTYLNVVVEVVDINRNPVGKFSVNQSGSFDIQGISGAGNYTMTVRAPNGSEIVSQMVNVQPNTGPVTIRLPEAPGKETPSGSSVSLHQLSHKVPKAAKKEFEKASRAGSDHPVVIAHLRKAVEIDPYYMEALNNLGSRYIQVHQLDDALAVLTRAQAIDPASAKVHTNLAVVLLSQKKVEAAEQAARRAFQLDSNDPKCRYILGLTLYNKRDLGDETIGLLRSCMERFPNARIALAWLYAEVGKKNEARGLLQAYLAAGYTDREPQVRQMLARLK